MLTKPAIRIGFAHFWPGFAPEQFKTYFPFVYEKYDLTVSPDPEVLFYSVFSPQFRPYSDPRYPWGVAKFREGNYLRVFFTGENFEPVMDECEFAMTFSALTISPNHLRLPLWVYENRGSGFAPELLVKTADREWEKVAAGKTEFCNFVYFHEVPYRNKIFSMLERYKRVDAAGRCMNNMNAWCVPCAPNRLAGKVAFFKRYKFSLAVENMVWPGYMTEKLVDPMYADSIPVYVGDPLAGNVFNPEGYIDLARFGNLQEMIEFVREVDNDRDLYLKMLAAPYYRKNRIPDCAREDKILAFFDRIFEAAMVRRQGAVRRPG
jgi:hypothetical protein